jgi:glycosyltransferase involved in cell wall biosynthesis
MSDVSVLMTVFNGMPYLPLAVESVLAQTLQNFQFVIVNDGSTDGTAEYLASLTDPRITVLQQTNRGTAAAANHGLARIDSPFVARMDADDVTLPTRLERQRDFLLANPQVGLVGTQVVPLGSSRAGSSLQLPLTHGEIYPAMLSGRHGLAHSSIMLRTDLLRAIGGYWSLNLVDDWDMMLRMGEAAELANLPEVLHHYRVHEGSLNGSGMRRMRFSIDYACELARRRHTGRPQMSPEDFAANRNARPWWVRATESLDLHARTQYRLAVAELHGRRRMIGAARLAWAALCSPQLTLERLTRVFRKETQLRKEARA